MIYNTSFIIVPEGGVVIGEGGIVLDIPPGALDEDAFISVKLISEVEIPIPPPEGSFLIMGVELKPVPFTIHTF